MLLLGRWWGGVKGVHLTECQPDSKADQMSSWPKVISLLANRCLYWGAMGTQGVHLTKGQPDSKADQMSRWPNIVPLLATRYLYSEVHLTKVSLSQILDKNVNLTQSLIYRGGSIWKKGHLKIWAHFLFHALLHRGLVNERPTRLACGMLDLIGVADTFYEYMHILARCELNSFVVPPSNLSNVLTDIKNKIWSCLGLNYQMIPKWAYRHTIQSCSPVVMEGLDCYSFSTSNWKKIAADGFIQMHNLFTFLLELKVVFLCTRRTIFGSLIRLLSLSVYMLDKTENAETK